MHHHHALVALSSLTIATLSCTSGGTSGKRSTAKPPSPIPLRQVITSKAISTQAKPPLKTPPSGPFSLALLTSADGKKTDIKRFQMSQACAECHPRQWRELKGSMHSVAHGDTLYRHTAELALKEGGPALYTYCSACHTPQGVTSRLIQTIPEAKLPPIVKAGILCDSCHSISKLTGPKGPWGEPGNASFVLAPDPERKFGPPTGDNEAADHPVETRAFFQRSELCASCHTVIHARNGVRIEHTYGEWKKSVYAQKGIQCQDCHMRTVKEASEVARTMKAIVPRGKSTPDGQARPIAHHVFAGGNASADLVGGGAGHAKIAEARLKSAARLDVLAPKHAVAGKALRLSVVVTNIGAGHSLPTSLTELRQIWVDLTIRDAKGKVLFRSGALDAKGDIDRKAMRFGAEAADKNGKLTYKPWEITHFRWKRLIKAKASARDAFTIPIPIHTRGPLTIDTKLLYRSAPPVVLKLLYGDHPPPLRTVEMAHVETRVALP